MKKKSDGVFWKRGAGREIIYFWRMGKDRSKDFIDHKECAMDYINKYIERNPKYKEFVSGKTCAELFRMFSINL